MKHVPRQDDTTADMTPTIVAIVGVSGDLSRRKLLPAIEHIHQSGWLPSEFALLGLTRQPEVTVRQLTDGLPYVSTTLEVLVMDLADQLAYARLLKRLDTMAGTFTSKPQVLLYLSVPPGVSGVVIEHLGRSGITAKFNTKLLLEKPFGVDLTSARTLLDHASGHFKEAQMYRIDHYLAKEMVQNILVFRSRNTLFKRTWNNQFIESIEITASEQIGIEGRGHFYEQTGALRDVVQSHLLQLAALVLMDLPETMQLGNVPKLRQAALANLSIDQSRPVIRGQYDSYAQEAGNPGSAVETFVSMYLKSSNLHWQGVPIKITTGKALSQKKTEIKLTYTKDHQHEANELIFSLQPHEGASLNVWSKRPGYDKQLEAHRLQFQYADHYRQLPEAYEQVFIDVIKADHSLFVTSEEVVESWRILEPVQEAWSVSNELPIIYKSGSDSISIGR